MAERRLSNSEAALQRLEEEEAAREDDPGILEIFGRDEDDALVRDDERE